MGNTGKQCNPIKCSSPVDLDLKGQQYSEPTKCIGKQIDYMAKPETKLNDFNREASKSYMIGQMPTFGVIRMAGRGMR